MDRKKELDTILRKARTELNRIEEAERDAENRALIGKCFKYRNSYSEGQKWWLYQRVVSVKGGMVNIFGFETDIRGKIEIYVEKHMWAHTLGQAISLGEFRTAWRATMRKIEKLSVANVD